MASSVAYEFVVQVKCDLLAKPLGDIFQLAHIEIMFINTFHNLVDGQIIHSFAPGALADWNVPNTRRHRNRLPSVKMGFPGIASVMLSKFILSPFSRH
jgi:hypothetical protein